ncbi:MAG: hypothetical protein GF331_09085 [Chitinivibrionales bacterium]|nr:hypothetical protein [Chitinivibrionales bacterium]
MLRLLCTLSALLFLAVHSPTHACMGELDRVSAGVLFNSAEPFDLSRLERLGADGESYLKECPEQTAQVAKPVVMLTPDLRVPMYRDPARIEETHISDSRLIVKVTYSGGCAAHTFGLYAETALMESLPPIARVYLSHNANGDLCESMNTETLVFDITAFEEYFAADAPVWLDFVAPQDIDNPGGNESLRDLLWYPQTGCSIKYRSHSFDEAMVYLGFYAPGPQSEQLFPRMVFAVDPDIVFVAPFDFGTAVVAELGWLAEQGVISGIAGDREAIADAVRGGNAQYWTLQDTALAYNQHFTYARDSSGAWQWGSIMVTRSCGTGVTYAVPQAPLATAPRPSSGAAERTFNGGVNWQARTAPAEVTVELGQPLRHAARMRVVDLRGRELWRGSIAAGAASVALPRRDIGSSGWRIVELRTRGEQPQRRELFLGR